MLVQEPAEGIRTYAPQDLLLTDRERHERMAKASGWHPNITAARSLQQALNSFA